jgi:hypothetical protein
VGHRRHIVAINIISIIRLTLHFVGPIPHTHTHGAFTTLPSSPFSLLASFRPLSSLPRLKKNSSQLRLAVLTGFPYRAGQVYSYFFGSRCFDNSRRQRNSRPNNTIAGDLSEASGQWVVGLGRLAATRYSLAKGEKRCCEFEDEGPK